MKNWLRRRAPLAVSDDNPLRRGVDRTESAIIVGLVFFFLLAAPFLGTAGGRSVAKAAASTQRQESSWRLVRATIEEGGAAGLAGSGGDWNVSFVLARWTAPAGGTRSGELAVRLTARAGQTVPVWVTHSGQLTRPPLSRADLRLRVGLVVFGMVGGLALALTAIAGIVRLLGNRRRLAGWERDWASTAPRWTSRR